MPTRIKFKGVITLKNDPDHRKMWNRLMDLLEKIEDVGDKTIPEYVEVSGIEEMED